MGFKGILTFLEMIKFEHTVFALPFAYMTLLLTQEGWPSVHHLFWITAAMVGARTAAMSLNRLIDRHIDAKNPRTADRALPRSLISGTLVWLFVGLSFALLFVAAWRLSPLALKLFLPLVLILWLYSYTKRVTWTCHFYLGLTLGLVPVAVWVAINNGFAAAPVLLGCGVLFWVAGFDIVYACMDYDFDRQEGIYSVPARFGIERAFGLSRACHVLAPLFFIFAGRAFILGGIYYLGVAFAVAVLIYGHQLVQRNEISRVGGVFLNLNGFLSVGMFFFTLLDVAVRRLGFY